MSIDFDAFTSVVKLVDIQKHCGFICISNYIPKQAIMFLVKTENMVLVCY